jgi:N-ethylmaleimide reductase
MYTDAAGMQPLDEPRALALEEIPRVVEDYRLAACNAREAGFDGVELHCTSGYLPAQFLSTGSNHRDDAYGGGVENRIRFPVEVLEALVAELGCGRVGMRICPDNPFNDLQDDDPKDTFEHFLTAAAALDLAYLHVIRMPSGRVDNLALGRKYFPDRLIANESYGAEEAGNAIAAGELSAVSFGRAYIANPDLVERFRSGSSLAKMDMATLYTPGPAGYTDYPPAD